jgi:hypothetical protein
LLFLCRVKVQKKEKEMNFNQVGIWWTSFI